MTDGQDLLYTGKILPVLFSAFNRRKNLKQGELNYILKFIYKNWRVGESKTGRISLRSVWGEYKTGRIQSCIQ